MKDKKILYGIIIAFIFLLSIGLTYAYFSVTTTVIGDRNDIRANAGILSILYTDGPEIVGNNINPGWTETKVVKVKNTGTLKAYYTLMWDSLVNEITNDELVFSATCTSDIGTCDDLEITPVGADELAIGVGIEAGEEQTYTLTFEFLEISSAQNYNQGKAFNGVLRVEDSLQTFALTGMLLDSNGDPIENAVIEVHSKVRTGITDENGIFGIAGIEVGGHELTVKNLSNEVIATDSITLAGGQSETISNKDIVADTNSAAINMTIKLGETDIDTISTWNYEEICAINPNTLGCKLYESNIRVFTKLNGGTLSTTFKNKYTKNETVIVGNPYKEGYFFSGWSVNGSGASIENGILKLGASAVTLTANYIASSEMYTYTGNSTFINDGNGNFRIKFLTSGTFTPYFDMGIDAFLVGGGGGGGSAAGGGGGGGYTLTQQFITLTSGQSYPINIGNGGAGGLSNAQGTTGESSTAFSVTANGGIGGGGWYSSPACKGGNGGSGGSGGTNGSLGPAGGNDGNNGSAGGQGSYGFGQVTTTREFGLPAGTLYSSGGGGSDSGTASNGAGAGGARGQRGSDAVANTGGGGGGGGSNGGLGGNGGSGIIVIRNASTPCVGDTVKYCFKYTGKMNIDDANTDSWKVKLLTDGKLTPYFNMQIDAFLVGGGGGGGSAAGGGGGGGYTLTANTISLTSNQEYQINIGAGGAGGPSNAQGLTGGVTTAFGFTANGGIGGNGWNSSPRSKGGDGGSGGSGSTNGSTGPAGGNDGSNGTAGGTGTFGIGQGTTTREFGLPTGKLYGSGGGGANLGVGSNGAGTGGTGGGVGSNAVSNTGGGGGGGGSSGGLGGAGGSGIVVIRAKN